MDEAIPGSGGGYVKHGLGCVMGLLVPKVVHGCLVIGYKLISVGYTSTTNNKFLIYSRRIIVSDTRKKNFVKITGYSYTKIWKGNEISGTALYAHPEDMGKLVGRKKIFQEILSCNEGCLRCKYNEKILYDMFV